MDHEFDRTGRNREQTPEDRKQSDPRSEPPTLERPPDGPSAAHFREAARLAAARARKAIEKDRTQPAPTEAPKTPEQDSVPDETTFANAARKRAMHVSGRDSEAEPASERPTPETKPPAPTSTGKKATKEAISQIDERLMLGARMLRAFESQIERLNSAAERAESMTGGSTPVETPPEPGTPSGPDPEQQKLVERAEVVLSRLETETGKAADTARSMANSIEIAGGISDRQACRTEELAATERALDTKITSVLKRTEHALESMEACFRRVMEIERAVMIRIDQAMARLEPDRAPAPATHTVPESGPVERTSKPTPLIEVEALQRTEEMPEESTPEGTPAPPATELPDGGSDEALSVGTLSIDPSLLTRRRERDQ